MTTPTPYTGIRGELDELLTALPGLRSGAPARAIIREVHRLFDLTTATPAPPKVEQTDAPEQGELLTITNVVARRVNGIDPPGRE